MSSPLSFALSKLWPFSRLVNGNQNPESYRPCWDYSFYLTPQHMSLDESERLKHSCDRLADMAYTVLADLPSIVSKDGKEGLRSDELVESKVLPEAAAEMQAATETGEQEESVNERKPRIKRDLYILLRDNAASNPTLHELWTEVNTVPEWVDWHQIARGQEVFYRYGGPALMGLAFQSLLGGMGAGRVVETLSRTGGFSTKVARHRLLETTQHILQCTRSLESLQPGGDGFASSIRVRLLHAAVRTSILKLALEDSNYYDISTLGIPINDLDCIATIVTFSSSLIWISFPRQGIFISRREAEDYVALWRYIAYLTGTPPEYFESPESARRAMETLLLHEIKPTETSKILAHNVIECLALQPPNYPSREFLEAFARWLNGDKLCDALGLGRPGWYCWSLVAGQVMFSMWISYTTRLFRSLDKTKIALLKEVFWNIIVESKLGLGSPTIFDYKYRPRKGKITRPSKGWQHPNAEDRVERRNFIVFVSVSVTVVSISLVALRLLPSVAISLRHSLIHMQYTS